MNEVSVELQLAHIDDKLTTLTKQLDSDGLEAAPIRCHEHNQRLKMLENTLENISRKLWLVIIPVTILLINQMFTWYWRVENIRHTHS